MKNSYGWLLGIFVLCCVGCFLSKPDDFLRDASLNLGAGIVGSALVIFFIDRVIEEREAQERDRKTSIVLRELSKPLCIHVALLQRMYKVSVPPAFKNFPQSVSSLFADDFYKNISHLDFSKKTTMFQPAADKIWLFYFEECAEKFRLELHSVLEKYAVFMNSDTLELIENIRNHLFIRGFQEFYKPNLSLTLLCGEDMLSSLRLYLNNIEKLINTVNQIASIDNKIDIDVGHWSEVVCPKIASARQEDPIVLFRLVVGVPTTRPI